MMKITRIALIATSVLLAAGLVGCSAGGSKGSLGGLTSEEKQAVETVDKLMDAFENQDIDAIDAILYSSSEMYNSRNEKHWHNMENLGTRKIFCLNDEGNYEVEADTTHIAFVYNYAIWRDDIGIVSQTDFLRMNPRLGQGIADAFQKAENYKLVIKPEYKSIRKMEDCTIGYKDGLKLVDSTLTHLVNAENESDIEAAYVIEMALPYYWDGKLYGHNQDLMVSILDENSSLLQTFENNYELVEQYMNDVCVVSYKRNGEWHVFMDEMGIGRFVISWDGKDAE